MKTCDRWRDAMLEFVYGLLDEPECRELQEHVVGCPACQSALTEAQAGKVRLSRAALAIRDVAPFEAPKETIASTALAASAPAPQSAVPTSAPKKHALVKWMLWTVVGATVASIAAFAVFLANEQETLISQRRSEVALTRKQVEAVDGEYAALKSRFERNAKDVVQKAASQMQQVEIAGPYMKDDAQTVNISVQNAIGEREANRIQVQAFDKDSNKVLSEQVALAKGYAQVKIPEGLSGRRIGLRVEAQNLSTGKKAVVEETLAVASSSYVAHLAINKTSYFPNEVLFFRVLALQRFSLRPPEQPLRLRVALVDSQGNRVLDRIVVSGEGGIAAGELSLLPNLPGGSYILEATGEAGDRDLLAVRRPLELVRDDDIRFAMHNRALRVGANSLNVEVYQNGAPLAQKNLNVRVQAFAGAQNPNNMNNVPTANQSLGEGRGTTNRDGQAQIPLQIPKGVEADRAVVEIEVELKDGKEKRRIAQEIRVVPSKLLVDFFPEGGDLIAGAVNRVYWRVRSGQGEPVRPDGHVIVLDSKSVLYDSERAQAAGVFEFVPDPKEKYILRITSPQGTTQVDDPFASLGIRDEGIRLRIDDSVTPVGDLVAVDLDVRGAERNLVLTSVCRGRAVEQFQLRAKPGVNKAKLDLTAPGVHRVTVFELGKAGQRPVAERLVYRLPNRRLDVKAETGTGQAAPGQKASLHLHVVDEAKQAIRGWSLASVVDERYVEDAPDLGLGTHFLLLNEVRSGEDVDEAVLLPLSDKEESRKAIDLFLGSVGWRRLVDRQNERNQTEQAMWAAAPTFFRQASASPAKLAQEFQTYVASENQKLEADANRQRALLAQQREEAARSLLVAKQALDQALARPSEWLHLAQGGLAALGLLVGIVGIGFAAFSRIRGRSAAGAYGVAFGGLAACVALFLFRSEPVVNHVASDGPAKEGSYAPFKAPVPAAPERTEPSAPENFQVVVANDMLRPMLRDGAAALANTVKAENLDRLRSALANATQTYAELKQGRGKAADELQRRFAESAKMQHAPGAPRKEEKGGSPGAGGSEPKATKKDDPTKDSKKDATGGAGAGLAGMTREYAYRREAGIDYQDTLLWHPSLPIVDGSAHATFDLGNVPANYRVLIHAHDADGRFGSYEGRLEIKAGRK